MSGQWIAIVALLTVSFMWPSEGAANGDGLHWSVLWLLLAAVCCWRHQRTPENSDWKSRGLANRMDRFALWIVVAGVWLSTANVFQFEGDRRTALNVAFEWTAVLAASVLCWQLSVNDFRQRMGPVIIGIGLGAAVMGILQHHIVWDQRAEWYVDRISAIEAWQQTGVGAVEASQAEAELRAAQVPLEGSAQESFRRRLLDSTEAVGPFALANTLGGFLAAALVMLLGGIWNGLRNSVGDKLHWKSLVLSTAFAAVLGYSLILTKSRTAWVAVVAGGVWLLVATRKRRAVGAGKWRSIAKPVAAFCVVGILLLAVGVAGGAIDREVLLESPRSLRFRLMYWIGTLDLLKDRWLFGTGPGNFRNAYLEHKIPEASEQILDPHNLLLDTYCSAGLLGGIGLLILLFGVIRQSKHQLDSTPDIPVDSLRRGSQKYRGVATAASVSALLFIFWHWFTGASVVAEIMQLPDGGLLVLAIPLSVVVSAYSHGFLQIDRSVFQASFAALVVHLMGAGAFQISAVGLMLACLHRGGCGFRSPESAKVDSDAKVGRDSRFLPSSMTGAVCATAFASVAVTAVVVGLIPIRAAQHAMAASRVAEGSGRLDLAISELEDGIQADEINVNLRQRKAEVLAYVISASVAGGDPSAPISEQSEKLFQEALLACRGWRISDVTGYREFIVRSQVLEAWWGETKKKNRLIESVEAMELAVEYYPTSAEALSRLAIVQEKAGLTDAAEKSAASALVQDEINRAWGHAELYLTDTVVEQLHKIQS